MVHPLEDKAIWAIPYGGLACFYQLGLEEELRGMLQTDDWY